MPVTITVGINSYLDVIEADVYFNNRLASDTWANTNDDNKARALIMATKKIDRLAFKGTKADYKQKLQFPRALKTDYKHTPFSHLDGTNKAYQPPPIIVENVVSQSVKDAVCEETLALLENINNKRIKLQQQGVTSYSIGDLREVYSGKLNKLLSLEALELLKPYLAGSVSIW